MKNLFTDIQKIGIIYSAKNADSEALLEEYQLLADTYGMEVVVSEIQEDIDIDLVASQLVGSVDCIFCIEDDKVTPLTQTIRAYADEVEIPVIGAEEEHVKLGALASYKNGTLYWNSDEAGKFAVTPDNLNVKDVVTY